MKKFNEIKTKALCKKMYGSKMVNLFGDTDVSEYTFYQELRPEWEWKVEYHKFVGFSDAELRDIKLKELGI